MRKLPLLLLLLLLSVCLLAAASASAHAAALPSTTQGTALTASADDDEGEEADDESEAEDDEGEESEDESEACEAEDAEEEEFCEEVREQEEAEACVLEDASVSVAVAPGAHKVRLTIRYSTFEPADVLIDARSRGGKGGLHLGSDRARFRSAGVYHGSFALGGRQLAKALAAREFDVDLRPVGTPADCEMQLSTRAHHRAR